MNHTKGVNRREFSKSSLMLGMGLVAGSASYGPAWSAESSGNYYEEPVKKLPVRKFDVVVAGGGTAGVVAALAAVRQGAKTALIESKGYTGGTVTEGGTALHSFFNLPTLYPGVGMRQVVRGIPSEIIDRLIAIEGTSGHAPMVINPDYDPVATVIDTELYKLLTMRMLDEDGVFLALNTSRLLKNSQGQTKPAVGDICHPCLWGKNEVFHDLRSDYCRPRLLFYCPARVTDAVMDGSRIRGVIAESHQGREIIYAKSFVDCTGWGDLSRFE